MKKDIAVAFFEIPKLGTDSQLGQIQLLPSGKFRATDGRPKGIDGWFVKEGAEENLISQFNALSNDLVVDYNHASLIDGAEAPASGWMKEFIWDNGLIASTEWTPRAKKSIEGDEYRYISPVFIYNKETGEVLEIINAALTNTPALDGMAKVALAKLTKQYHKENEPMPEETEEQAELSIIFKLASTKSDLLYALGLSRDATGEQMAEAFNIVQKKIEAAETAAMAAKKQVADLNKQLDNPTDLTAAIEQLKNKSTGTVPKGLFAKSEATIAALKSEKQAATEENIKLQRASLIREAQYEYKLPEDIDSEEMAYALSRETIADLKDYISICKSNRPPKENQTGGIAPLTANNALPQNANPKSVIAAQETAKLARELGMTLEDAAIELASRKEAM